MPLRNITAGNVPDEINVIIEIPLSSEPVKYEVDKQTHAMFVDRFLSTAMHYPCNYGYVPDTLCGDGDPIDVCVIAPLPVISGSIIRCRPVGILNMEDDGGEDHKLIAVPIDKLTSLYSDISTVRDIRRELLDRISHFFEHYKDLEQGKWVKIYGWGDVESAKRELLKSVEMHESNS
jgi:inorganic pyrophosphatase